MGKIFDSNGNIFPFVSLSTTGEKLASKTPGGLESGLPLGAIRSIDFSTGNSLSLTEMRFEKTEVKPFFDVGQQVDLFFQPRTGKSFFGPLRLGGITYNEGLSMKSHTTTTYRLSEPFKFFTATVGINDDVKEHGDVQLIISGDGKVLFDRRITGKNSPMPVSIPIEKVNRLTFEVYFGDHSDIGDILDVVNPRLYKEPVSSKSP